ncbi:MAG: hypothetical protein M1827_005886 [Pycnora praestabilis]|nr:MAG: hypothetical protein M1827_005886 [Pycnora praestabilis]
MSYFAAVKRAYTEYRTFFSGDLARFNIEADTLGRATGKAKGPRRLNTVSVIDAVGEVVTQHTPILEVLSGEILSSALSRWAVRLPRLQRLELFHGTALAEGAEGSIHTHCPSFHAISFYEWRGERADQQLASFFSGLRPQTVEYFQIYSYSDIGPASFIALSNHSISLKELRLSGLKAESVAGLSLLKECTAIELLFLDDFSGTTDLEKTQNDVFLEIIAWLTACKRLRSISLKKFINGPSILTPVLLENDIHLERLELEGYTMRDNMEFHQALPHQEDLQGLMLKGDGEDVVRDDLDVLIGSLTKLTNLRDLELREISDYFGDEHIRRLARALPKLEEFWTSGYGISDAIWNDMSLLGNLRSLSFNAMTGFTMNGLLNYISSLGQGNKGLTISVLNADTESNLDEHELGLVRETLASKVEGRFDFVPMGDPDQSDFEDSGSD